MVGVAIISYADSRLSADAMSTPRSSICVSDRARSASWALNFRDALDLCIGQLPVSLAWFYG